MKVVFTVTLVLLASFTDAVHLEKAPGQPMSGAALHASGLEAAAADSEPTAAPIPSEAELVEILATGDSDALNEIYKAVDTKLIPELYAAVKSLQGKLDEAWKAFDTCSKASTSCFNDVTTLKNAKDTATSSEASAKTAMEAAAIVKNSGSCPADLSFAGDDANDEVTKYIADLTTYVQTKGKAYTDAATAYKSAKTTLTTAEGNLKEKEGECKGSCKTCSDDAKSTFNKLVSEANKLLQGQQDDLRTYELIKCVAKESADKNNNQVLAACRTQQVDVSKIKYEVASKTPPTIDCKVTPAVAPAAAVTVQAVVKDYTKTANNQMFKSCEMVNLASTTEAECKAYAEQNNLVWGGAGGMNSHGYPTACSFVEKVDNTPKNHVMFNTQSAHGSQEGEYAASYTPGKLICKGDPAQFDKDPYCVNGRKFQFPVGGTPYYARGSSCDGSQQLSWLEALDYCSKNSNTCKGCHKAANPNGNGVYQCCTERNDDGSFPPFAVRPTGSAC
jgi:hypothetical protein